MNVPILTFPIQSMYGISSYPERQDTAPTDPVMNSLRVRVSVNHELDIDVFLGLPFNTCIADDS